MWGDTSTGETVLVVGRIVFNATTEVLVKNVVTVLFITLHQEIVPHVTSPTAKHVPK